MWFLKNDKKHSSSRSFNKKIIFVFAAVFLFSIMSIQNNIEVKKRRNDLIMIEQQIEEQKEQNAKIKAILEISDDAEYMERIAREQYGYVLPDEHVYVNKD